MHIEEPPRSQPEISLAQILEALWAGRWWILGISALVVAATFAAATLMPREYEATALLMPSSDQSEGSQLGAAAGLASQFGGLASLAGISLGGSGASAEAVAVLQSEILTTRFVEQESLLPILFADKWDAQAARWKGKPPTAWKANELIRKKVRTVTENTKTGLITLKITWTDPALAARWANGFVQLTNEYLRDKALAETERNVVYLTAQAQQANIVELRNAIYSLMESEIKKQMLARGRREYALRLIDPATAPERHSSPKRAVWCFAALCIGLVGASTFVIARRLGRRR